MPRRSVYEKESVNMSLKKANMVKLRYIADKFGISISRMIDSRIEEFLKSYEQEFESENFQDWLEKFMTREEIDRTKRTEKKEKKKKLGLF